MEVNLTFNSVDRGNSSNIVVSYITEFLNNRKSTETKSKQFSRIIIGTYGAYNS